MQDSGRTTLCQILGVRGLTCCRQEMSSDSQNLECSDELRRSNQTFLCCSCDVFLMPLLVLCAFCCKHAHPESLRDDGCDVLLSDWDVCLPYESLLIFPFHSPRMLIMIAGQNHCCPMRVHMNCPTLMPTKPSSLIAWFGRAAAKKTTFLVLLPLHVRE